MRQGGRGRVIARSHKPEEPNAGTRASEQCPRRRGAGSQAGHMVGAGTEGRIRALVGRVTGAEDAGNKIEWQLRKGTERYAEPFKNIKE